MRSLIVSQAKKIIKLALTAYFWSLELEEGCTKGDALKTPGSSSAIL